MAKYVVDSSSLTAVADAIRGKNGGTDPLTLDQMAEEISGISVNDDYLGKLINKQVTELVSKSANGTIPQIFQEGNTNLRRIDMPLVKKIGSSAFAKCEYLQDLNLPSVTEVDSAAFNACNSLTKVYFPNLEKITGWGYVFSACNKLARAYFPKLTSIVAPVGFSNDALLTVFVLGASSVCTLSNSDIFSNTPIAKGTGHIYVKKSLLSSYQSASNWSVYSSQFRAIEDYPEVLEGWE
jgi:hypothetical protein